MFLLLIMSPLFQDSREEMSETFLVILFWELVTAGQIASRRNSYQYTRTLVHTELIFPTVLWDGIIISILQLRKLPEIR